MTSPFDTITGLHLLAIDTSNDTGDAGFWTIAADYSVVLIPDETVDSQTVVAVIATFSIENRFAEADLCKILGSALTEDVGGYLTAAFKKLFNVATPVATAASVNQTGDAYVQALKLDGAATATPAAATTGSLLDRLANKSGDKTYSATTDSLEALRDRGDSAWVTATGFNTVVPDVASTLAGLIGVKNGIPKLDASTGLIITGFGGAGVTLGTVTTLTSAPTNMALETSVQDVPTVTEFNARTLVSADYFVVADFTGFATPANVTSAQSAIISALPTAPDNAGITSISGVVSSLTYGNAALKTLIDALVPGTPVNLEIRDTTLTVH
jgi:hypothetical protein